MINHEPTDRCKHCYQEFADHNYVTDSIDQYECPFPKQESGYGFFHGGDPRNFHPCHEDCTEAEIANHKKACQLWDECEAKGETPEPEKCPSGWILDDEGKPLMHILRAPYGIGTYVEETTMIFEPIAYDYSEDYDGELF